MLKEKLFKQYKQGLRKLELPPFKAGSSKINEVPYHLLKSKVLGSKGDKLRKISGVPYDAVMASSTAKDIVNRNTFDGHQFKKFIRRPGYNGSYGIPNIPQ